MKELEPLETLESKFEKCRKQARDYFENNQKLFNLVENLILGIKAFMQRSDFDEEDDKDSLIKIIEEATKYLKNKSPIPYNRKERFERVVFNFQDKFIDLKDIGLSKLIAKVIAIFGALVGAIIGFCGSGPAGAALGGFVGAMPGLAWWGIEDAKECAAPSKGISDVAEAIIKEVERIMEKENEENKVVSITPALQ